jgi:hypothetical protein
MDEKMSWDCSMHENITNADRILYGILEWKVELGRLNLTREDNIKIDLKKGDVSF